jgi:hypothetical protein
MSFRSVFGRSQLAAEFWAFVGEFPALLPRDVEKYSVIWFCADYSEVSRFSQECSARFGISVKVEVFGIGWLVSVPRCLPNHS